MDSLPALRTKTSLPEPVLEKLHEGWHPNVIAKKAYPRDERKRKILRMRIWRYVEKHYSELGQQVGTRGKLELMFGLVPASQALTRKAATGRTDAIKLLFEASGFHNPRVQHEHKGDIKITLDIPRPKAVEDVIDAEVVE